MPAGPRSSVARIMTFRIVMTAAFAALLLAACRGSSDDGAAAVTVSTPVPTYSADEFTSRVLETEPKGISIRFDAAAGSELGIESVSVEADIATLPAPAIRILIRFVGRAEVQIETIITGDDLYYRGSVGDEPGGWLKLSLGEAEAIMQNLSGGSLQPFRYEDLSGREWIYVGDEDCAVGKCFVIQSDDDENVTLHLRMTDYKPVRIHQPSASGFGDDGLTIDVISWDEVVDVQPPTDEFREATAQELGDSMIGVLLALGLGSE